MITAERLKQLTTLKKDALVSMLETGDTTPSWAYAIKKCRFLGLTNGGQFCYMAVFLVEGGTDSTKVFVTHSAGKVTAEVDKHEIWQYT